MTDKLELKSSHEVVYTVDVADVESIFYCKPTDPDILTVLMKDGKRLYCDEVCPIDSLQEEPVRRTSADVESAMQEVEEKSKAFTEAHKGESSNEILAQMRGEEPVSNDLSKYISELSKQFPEVSFAKLSRIAVRVAKWQKKQDQSIIELAEDHAMLAGMEKMKEEMMENATEVTVHIDAGGYPYTPEIELYDYDNDMPLAKEGDKYKVVLIKEE